MADSATVEEILNYYIGLLIIQYANKPKAQAHIGAIISSILANAIFLDVLNGYDLETAIGAQLDIIGKYQDVDRYYTQLDLENFYAYTTYSEINPDLLPKFGYCTYSTFDGYAYNGTLQYNDIILTKNMLADDDFRTIIKLAIIQNTSDYALAHIDSSLTTLFGSTIHKESAGNMAMWYFIASSITPAIQAILAKKLLPSPMAVKVGIALTASAGTFGFANYVTGEPSYASGFSQYSNYGTVGGQIITYDVLQQG